jgi:hypothetical protein
MKKLISLTFVLFLTVPLPETVTAQSSDAERIEAEVLRSDIEFNIYFLASDEFLGRDTGTHELDIAARYIATWFQTNGVEIAKGYDSYFQDVPLQVLTAPDEIVFSVGDSTYHKDEHLALLTPYHGEMDAPLIFLEYATEDELAENDVEGKIVVANAGLPGQTSPQELFMAVSQKNEWAENAGAKALIELYTHPQFPWQVLVGFLGGDRIDLDESDEEAEQPMGHFWMNGTVEERVKYLADMSEEPVSMTVTGAEPERFTSRNVVGVIRGTDDEMRDEYILLGAHYDHEGVAEGHPEPITSEYIYNGARDNAVGTAGILAAAKYFAEHPPKRSLILAAWTAEEKGLLGSRYYADNPMIPLEQTIYNLNIDGAGYNDTTKVTVIGLGRTEADDEMTAAADAFGLEAIPDPVPEQNLFDRSDNVNFAQRGIPAPTYSMGLTDFDDEINYYYHQPTDEPDTIDYMYITRYIRSFVLATQKIADREEAPFWIPGDVYEEAGLELYNIER